MSNVFHKLRTFDRRWIFLAMGLTIVIPFYVDCNVEPTVSPMVSATYFAVDEVKEGDVVLVSADIDPASTPELEPFFDAVIYQLKQKKAKIVFVSTWAHAPPLITSWLRHKLETPMNAHGAAEDVAYKRNVDFAWLGFREGKQAFITQMADDFRAALGHQDAAGKSLSDIPMLDGINSIEDFKMVILVSAGSPGIKEYVQQLSGKYDIDMIGACTAVSTSIYTPYYQTGQLSGLVGGLSAVAEYEVMVGRQAPTTKAFSGALNASHLFVIFAIVFGNIIYFATKGQTDV